MTLSIKSILSCLVILATASDIHMQQIQESESSKLLFASQGKTTVFGEGVKPGQLPIIAYSVVGSKFYVSAYIQTKHCNFEFFASSVDVKAVKQLGGNTVVFAWLVSSPNTEYMTISVFNMGTCGRKNINLQWERASQKFVVVVPFVEGFDVIMSDKSRTSYDTTGNLMGNSEAFLINSFDFAISAVSERLRYNGFFVVDNTHQTLNLVKVNGVIKKPLLKLRNVVFSNNEQSLYSLCAFDNSKSTVVHCFQYDQSGKENWHNKAVFRFRGKLEVKNLPGGGLAILNFALDRFSVVEMGPNQVKIWNYSMKQVIQKARLMDFNGKDRTFVLAYEIRQVKQGILEESVFSQKYSL